ncbi:MAG: hypothetical protein AAGC67_04830 [Myxococcota bacterium]
MADTAKRQIDHKKMRILVGLIALLLPVLARGLAGDRLPDLTSISISYWTPSRDVFVGALFAIGFFLSAYNGNGERRDLEFWVSKFACVFALFIALFPTEGFEDGGPYEPAPWIAWISKSVGLTADRIHAINAVLFFACLIVLIFHFAKRARSKRKIGRARAYLAIGGAMILGILVGGVAKGFLGVEDATYYLEWWVLWLFAGGWILAGAYKTEPDPESPPAPAEPPTPR